MLDKIDDLFFMPGGKLKAIAKINLILGCIASLILGILVFDDWHNMWLYSILIWVFGPLCSYISSLFIYGFAAIIDLCQSIYSNGSRTNQNLNNIQKAIENQTGKQE